LAVPPGFPSLAAIAKSRQVALFGVWQERRTQTGSSANSVIGDFVNHEFADDPETRKTHTMAMAMAMIRKGQVHNIDRHAMRARGAFVAGLFEITA
jgi:cytoplasmic iron level regulating protein YaaA (DUF328/UPF0246 family)